MSPLIHCYISRAGKYLVLVKYVITIITLWLERYSPTVITSW